MKLSDMLIMKNTSEVENEKNNEEVDMEFETKEENKKSEDSSETLSNLSIISSEKEECKKKIKGYYTDSYISQKTSIEKISEYFFFF